MRLLRLPPDIQLALKNKKISMGHARALITIDQVDAQLAIFNKVVSGDLSVRKTEQLVRELVEGKTAEKTKTVSNSELSYEMKEVRSRLSNHFGTKVDVVDKGNRGEIKIPYLSVEDLNRILEIIDL